MQIRYSSHARKRMIERDINEEQIKEAIDFPDYTIKRGREIEAYKKIAGKKLKVVYIVIGKFINIITIYYI